MRPTQTLVLASANRGKTAEISAILRQCPEVPRGIRVISLAEIVANPEDLKFAEVGKTYYENAYKKARLVQLATHYPVISDDTGLEVDALDGQPGLYSERYSTPRSGETKDEANVRKILEALHGVPKERRTARFVCTVVLFMEGLAISATGILEGSILDSRRGSQGFGYDPIFLVRGSEKTLAEMSSEEKNRISHRAIAVRNLMAEIRKRGFSLVGA